MAFEKGNKGDGKHYWLTPPDLYKKLNDEFNFDFDPCPYPLPDGFDSLVIDWGSSNYVNPPFGSYKDRTGKRVGPTAWARKAIEQHGTGRTVVIVYPIDKWILSLITSGAEVRNMGDIKWLATEDLLPGKGSGRHTAAFILRGNGSASFGGSMVMQNPATVQTKLALYK